MPRLSGTDHSTESNTDNRCTGTIGVTIPVGVGRIGKVGRGKRCCFETWSERRSPAAAVPAATPVTAATAVPTTAMSLRVSRYGAALSDTALMTPTAKASARPVLVAKSAQAMSVSNTKLVSFLTAVEGPHSGIAGRRGTGSYPSATTVDTPCGTRSFGRFFSLRPGWSLPCSAYRCHAVWPVSRTADHGHTK